MRNVYENNIMVPYRDLLYGGLLVQEYKGIANPLPTIDELKVSGKYQLVKSGMYPPEGIYKCSGNNFATVTLMVPKGEIPRLKNSMGSGIVYSVSKNGKMVYDTSSGSRPPSGIYGPGKRMTFTFSQTYGQVCFNFIGSNVRAVDVIIKNIHADGEWCIKLYNKRNPDGDTEPAISKYMLEQTGTTSFHLGEGDNGYLVSSIGIMSNGCTSLTFDEIYATSWELYHADGGGVVPAKYYPFQPYMDYSTKWYSDYSTEDTAGTILNAEYDLAVNMVTYIIKPRYDSSGNGSYQIPLGMFLN